MSRYLITGGAGFIGSHLCDALVARGDQVVIFDDFLSGKRGNIEQLGPKIDVIEGDVAAGLPPEIGQVDVIVHLAALISGFDSLREPDSYLRSNLTGLLRVIDFAAKQRVPRVVFASSSTVYGGAAGPGLTEAAPLAPITVYAATKLIGEHFLAMYSAVHGFSHCSLRLFNVYGPRQATDHPYANVTCKFSHAAAHDLPVILYGDGEQTRDFIYIDDVVRAFVLVLEGAPSPIYNIGTGREARIRDLIVALEEIGGDTLDVHKRPAWQNDIRRVSADISRAREELGFEPRVRLSEGLRRTVDFFRQR